MTIRCAYTHDDNEYTCLLLRATIAQILIDDNVRTGDLGGKATNHAITEAIVHRPA